MPRRRRPSPRPACGSARPRSPPKRRGRRTARCRARRSPGARCRQPASRLWRRSARRVPDRRCRRWVRTPRLSTPCPSPAPAPSLPRRSAHASPRPARARNRASAPSVAISASSFDRYSSPQRSKPSVSPISCAAESHSARLRVAIGSSRASRFCWRHQPQLRLDCSAPIRPFSSSATRNPRRAR